VARPPPGGAATARSAGRRARRGRTGHRVDQHSRRAGGGATPPAATSISRSGAPAAGQGAPESCSASAVPQRCGERRWSGTGCPRPRSRRPSRTGERGWRARHHALRVRPARASGGRSRTRFPGQLFAQVERGWGSSTGRARHDPLGRPRLRARPAEPHHVASRCLELVDEPRGPCPFGPAGRLRARGRIRVSSAGSSGPTAVDQLRRGAFVVFWPARRGWPGEDLLDRGPSTGPLSGESARRAGWPSP